MSAHSMTNDNRRISRPPPKEVACTTIREGSKDAERFVRGSYTLRAIFRPWKPIGPNRYSLEGWVQGSSPFSCPYSPKCVVKEFSEVGLPLTSVLRSSPGSCAYDRRTCSRFSKVACITASTVGSVTSGLVWATACIEAKLSLSWSAMFAGTLPCCSRLSCTC
jgi:hypothetical protein